MTDPAAVRAAFEPRGRDVRRASTSSSPMPARPGRAGSARSTTQYLRAELRTEFLRPPDGRAKRRRASCGRREPAAACCSTCRSRRSTPVPNFGPYGLPKAATLALMRQYALDYGAARHPRQRRQCRPHPRRLVDPGDDRRPRPQPAASAKPTTWPATCCGREVTAEDVAQAFLNLALALKTTADVTPSTAATSPPRYDDPALIVMGDGRVKRIGERRGSISTAA